MLKSLLKPLKLDYINPYITDENFPDNKKRGKVELIHFNEFLSTGEVLKMLDDKGYRPATLHEMLVWAKDWKGEIVVALGSVWQSLNSGRSVGFLSSGGGESWLSMSYYDGDWGVDCRFAAVKKDDALEDDLIKYFKSKKSLGEMNIRLRAANLAYKFIKKI